MNISDITFTYTLDKVQKNKSTGMIDEVIFTYSGTAEGQTASIAHNKQCLMASDVASAEFIEIDKVTKENVIAWLDASISEVITFDIEEARVTDIVPWLDENDPKQPSNKDLTNFTHSSRKQQMQENIRLTIEKKLNDKLNVNEKIEHIF